RALRPRAVAPAARPRRSRRRRERLRAAVRRADVAARQGAAQGHLREPRWLRDRPAGFVDPRSGRVSRRAPIRRAAAALRRPRARRRADRARPRRRRRVVAPRARRRARTSGALAGRQAGVFQGMSVEARDWLARGNAYARGGELAAVAEAYRQTLAREPGWNDARFNLGLMQKKLGDRAAAIRAFHAAWVGDPMMFEAARQCIATIADAVRAGERKETPLPAPLSAAPDLMTSIVICSIDDAKHERAVALYRRLFAAARHEVVSIRDARSLAEAYNWALRHSVADVVVLSHDDVDVLTPDFAARLFERLQVFDIVGVAGSTRVDGPAIGWSGHPHLRGWITHRAPDSASWQVDVLDPRPVAGDIVLLDGV